MSSICQSEMNSERSEGLKSRGFAGHRVEEQLKPEAVND